MIKFNAVFNILLCVASLDALRNMSRKIIIDNDAGGDDAMAIFLALLYETHFAGPEVIGLTTVNGNTIEQNVYKNNQIVLKIAKRQDVPIYRGATTLPLTTPSPRGHYGKDGLGDNGVEYRDLVPAQDQNASSALIELSKTYEGQLIVVALGPLTNIATVLKKDPDFLSRLSQLYIGAGHIYSEQFCRAEMNARTDAEAYHIVAEHATPEKVTILPFSQVKTYLNFSRTWREKVFGDIETDIIEAQNSFERVSIQRGDRWQLLDPATVSIAIKPDLVEEFKYSKHNIVLNGEKRGIITNNFVNKTESNVRIAFTLKTEDYRRFLMDSFSRT